MEILLFVFVFVLAGLFLRPVVRRRRLIRRLVRSEEAVAGAVADGRMAKASGEILLQHLEGLRRECSGNNGS